MAFLVYLVLLLGLSGYSSGSYCVCKQGNEAYLQKTLDYACGAGADCTPILQNGACFQPNTVIDHCSYAVNSYFQRKGQAVGSCDFSGTATVSDKPPATVVTGCVYPSSSSNAGTPTTLTPGTNTGTGTGTGIPTTTTGTSPTVFGVGPTGSGMNDNSGAVDSLTNNLCFVVSTMTRLLISCLFLFRL